MPVKTNAVLCESIHLEANGKFILVGVLSGTIATDAPEFYDEVCLFMNFVGAPAGSHELVMRVTTPEGKSSSAQLDVSVKDETQGTTIQVMEIPLQTEESGLFKIEWRLSSEKRWHEIVTIPVEVNATNLENNI